MSGQILEIKNVKRTYASEETSINVLDDINLSVQKGEFISIIGLSGCGKTTLLRLIAGLDKPQGGQLILNGQEIKSPSPSKGYVFQKEGLFNWLTVEQNIAFGCAGVEDDGIAVQVMQRRAVVEFHYGPRAVIERG